MFFLLMYSWIVVFADNQLWCGDLRSGVVLRDVRSTISTKAMCFGAGCRPSFFIQHRCTSLLYLSYLKKSTRKVLIDIFVWIWRCINQHLHLRFIWFFLAWASQKGMCLLAASRLKLRPQVWHLVVLLFWATSIIRCSSFVGPSPLACLRPDLNWRDSAFHLGITSFAFFSSIFFSITAPFFMNFTCSLAIIRCSWALNSFLFFWKTFRHIPSCFLMLSGLNFLPHPCLHSVNSEGSYYMI